MPYKISVWSLYLDKIKLVVESYSKWLYDHPNLKIYYSGLYEMDMYLKFDQVQDSTDYKIYDKGKYFRYDLPLTVDGWVLSNIMYPTILKIILDIFLREGSAPHYQDTWIDEYIITSTGTN